MHTTVSPEIPTWLKVRQPVRCVVDAGVGVRVEIEACGTLMDASVCELAIPNGWQVQLEWLYDHYR